MSRSPLFRRLFILVLLLTLLSPLAFFATGVGQAALSLSPELLRPPDGWQSSPRAIAWRQLTLPLRLVRLLLYPALLLLFQLSGGAVAGRDWLESRLSPRPHRLAHAGVVLGFIALVDLGLRLVQLPLDFYSGFVLVHQFDLSTQSLAAWSRDYLVSNALELGVTLGLFGGLYLTMRLAPRRWPIWAGLGLTLFSFGYTLLEPVVITPLFYEIRPLEDETLRRRILTLAGSAGMVVNDVSVIDASRKTTRANAYFTGFGEARKIVLWDTLLNGYSPDEIEVVLAHEMGHWYYRHVLIALAGGSAASWLGLFGLRWLLARLWRPLGWRGPDDVAGLPLLLALMALIGILSLPVYNGVSRFGESQADDFALAISRKPEAFVSLFERLAVQNLSMLEVPAWEKLLFYTHPTPLERMNKAQRQTEGRGERGEFYLVSGQTARHELYNAEAN